MANCFKSNRIAPYDKERSCPRHLNESNPCIKQEQIKFGDFYDSTIRHKGVVLEPLLDIYGWNRGRVEVLIEHQ